MNLKRRDFLKTLSAATAGFLSPRLASAESSPTLWNILFFQSDQHNVHMIGADRQVVNGMDNPVTTCQTP